MIKNDKKDNKKNRKCVIKREIKFENQKSCLKAAQLERKKNYLRKKKIHVDSLKEDQKKFIKNKLILKTKQRFKSETHNVFTEEIKKIASSDDTKTQSIDSAETYAYGTSKDLICKKEKIKRNIIIKQYKNV